MTPKLRRHKSRLDWTSDGSPGSSSPESGVFSLAVLDSVSEIAIAMLARVMRQEFGHFPTEILATRPLSPRK